MGITLLFVIRHGSIKKHNKEVDEWSNIPTTKQISLDSYKYLSYPFSSKSVAISIAYRYIPSLIKFTEQ